MPNQDGTGPKKLVPKTGGKRGRCNQDSSQSAPSQPNTVKGIGKGGNPCGGGKGKNRGGGSGKYNAK